MQVDIQRLQVGPLVGHAHKKETIKNSKFNDHHQGPIYMVSDTRHNPPSRDNFTERLYGVVSCNSCPLWSLWRQLGSYILDKMAESGDNLSHLASGRRADPLLYIEKRNSVAETEKCVFYTKRFISLSLKWLGLHGARLTI